MDIIDTICDERLVLTDILTKHRRHLVNVLRNVKVVNLEDLDNICTVLQAEKKRYCGHEELRRSRRL